MPSSGTLPGTFSGTIIPAETDYAEMARRPLEAGILGGKLYLAAYAQHLGATGLTFYDDDVIRFFSPHAEGKSAIFLVAVGDSAKRLA